MVRMRAPALRAVGMLVVLAALVMDARSVRAGASLLVGVTYTACSQNGRYCAVADAKLAETTIFWIDERGNRNAFWSLDGWHRVVDVADDGEHVVVGSDMLGLVPANYDPDDSIVRIFRHGRLEHSVPLHAILREPGDLLRAGAYYAWGRYRGFDVSGRYLLERIDGSRVVVDLKTGELRDAT